MYAIVLDRNKQYFVKDNSIINVDFIDCDVDSIIDIDKILFLNDGDKFFYGTPFVSDKIVKFKVLKHFKDNKKFILKFRRRKHHMKRMGHRQCFTTLKVFFIGNR